MTGPTRGPHPDELISASLSGDLTAAERRQLDAHLADCATCQATLEAFTAQRRMVGKLRVIEPPRDLSARVRAGIETGRHAQLPWWRRTSTLLGFGASLATVAAGILAVVILTNLRPGPEVVLASSTPLPSAAPPVASFDASVEPSESVAPIPTPGPIADAADPVYSMALTGPPDNLAPTVRDGGTGQTIVELEALGIEGPPIAASLSPNETSLAYLVDIGLKGTVEVRVSNVIDGKTYVLGESAVVGPFVEQLAWSREGQYLAYAIADPEGQAGTNIWIFDTRTPENPVQLTDSGNAYVGSWDVDDEGELLWFSEAGSVPTTYAVRPYRADGTVEPLPDPIPAVHTFHDVFQPLLNRDKSALLFWRGVMEPGSAEGPRDWRFAQGGAPYVAGVSEDGVPAFSDGVPLFADLAEVEGGFTSAAMTWGPDSNTIAVWDASWPDPLTLEDGTVYPDHRRVYFGHLDDPRLLTASHAIDAADVPADARVVDVALAGTGRHLALTVAYNLAGDLDPPRAELLLVTRNTGDVADEVERVAGAAVGGWHGPAVYYYPVNGGAAP